VAFSGLLLISGLSCWAPHSFAGDRCAHFTFYWAVLALLLVPWALWKKQWAVLLPLLCMGGFHGWRIAKLWRSDPVPVSLSGTPMEVSLVCANLYVGNLRRPEGLATLMELDPDVFILMEVDQRWREFLTPLLMKYPHQLGNDGEVWLLSRFPMENQKQVALTREHASNWPGQLPWPADRPWAGNTLLQVNILAGGKKLRVVSIHPPVPSNSHRLAQQLYQVKAYGAALNDATAPEARVLMGDFNTTMFSSVMDGIKQSTGLRDAAAGYGYRVTWGPRLPREPLLPWLGLPLDHTLVSPQVKVTAADTGETPGSDHRWQRVRLQF
jgi:endonuclease/exonuclease/phosphatase (EEP) superfamily protein YafD